MSGTTQAPASKAISASLQQPESVNEQVRSDSVVMHWLTRLWQLVRAVVQRRLDDVKACLSQKEINVNALVKNSVVAGDYSRSALVALVFEFKVEDDAHATTQIEMAKLLVAAGARADVLDSLGNSALHCPCSSALMKIFMSANADAKLNVDATGNGFTPLHDQLMNINQAESALLIEAKADVTRLDPDGNNALILATAAGLFKLIPSILSRKADASVVNKKGETALTVAVASLGGNTLKCKSIIRKTFGLPEYANAFVFVHSRLDLQAVGRESDSGAVSVLCDLWFSHSVVLVRCARQQRAMTLRA